MNNHTRQNLLMILTHKMCDRYLVSHHWKLTQVDHPNFENVHLYRKRGGKDEICIAVNHEYADYKFALFRALTILSELETRSLDDILLDMIGSVEITRVEIDSHRWSN